MNDFFEEFLKRITLTPTQKDDAETKYNSVCKTIHKDFYPDREYNGDTKYLFWSYKKQTNIRPMSSDQDVDVLFKMPSDQFEYYDSLASNWQYILLSHVRDILKDTFSTTETIKPWGKVVLVQFSEWTHNVELLPAFEQEDWTFLIPDTSDWGSRKTFDPRKEVKNFKDSNSKTGWLTCNLSKIMKSWKKSDGGMKMKSFKLENFVISFLESYDYNWKTWLLIIEDLFKFLLTQSDILDDDKKVVERSLKRIGNVNEYIASKNIESAIEELGKIFWNQFPRSVDLYYSSKMLAAPGEQYIESRYPVELNPAYYLYLDCRIEQKWWQATFLSKLKCIRNVSSLEFTIVKTNVPHPYSIVWKVRNFGKQAESANDLRWQLYDDLGSGTRKEGSKYDGDHYVECYIIKDWKCVAKAKLVVPIKFIS